MSKIYKRHNNNVCWKENGIRCSQDLRGRKASTHLTARSVLNDCVAYNRALGAKSLDDSWNLEQLATN